MTHEKLIKERNNIAKQIYIQKNVYFTDALEQANVAMELMYGKVWDEVQPERKDNEHAGNNGLTDMKVFANKVSRGYGGGMILVAARSKEEAIETFHNDSRFDYMYDLLDGEYYENRYYTEDWVVLPEIEANVAYPRVLIEASYVE